MKSAEIDDYDDLIRGRSAYVRRHMPVKTLIVAIVMLLGGIIFLSLGFSIVASGKFSHGKDRGITFFVLGGLSKSELSHHHHHHHMI
jgi:hypothetical protein